METTVLLGTLSATDLLFAYFSHLSPVQHKEAQLVPMKVSAHVKNEEELDSTSKYQDKLYCLAW